MSAFATARRTLIGGIGYRWAGDASWGLAVSDELARQQWPDGVDIADLGYGAILASQDIGAAKPPYERVILLAAAERGREAGRIYTYAWRPAPMDAGELQARIREAGAGVIDLDHLLAIANYFGAWPADVWVMEFEPAVSGSPERLSGPATAALEEAIALVRERVLACAESCGGSV